MTTDTAERIIQYIAKNKAVTPKQLLDYLGIGAPALYRQLKKLQEQGKLVKAGSAPKVFYTLASAAPTAGEDKLKTDLVKLLNDSWLYITSLGSIEEGAKGFAHWCQKFNLPVAKTAAEYKKTLHKYDRHKRGGLVDGIPKIKTTFPEVYLDELYYLDFYSIERFGKTKLGALLLYAKQSQNRELMARLFSLVIPKIKSLVAKNRVAAVGFIPPTIARVVQLQKELERSLALGLPTLKIAKATNQVVVAQKTLNKLTDRVENAAGSIFIEEVPAAKRILLIDDAVGSGASMNETARKIKEKNPGAHIIGLAITGSYKGFDVLNEV